VEIIFNYETAEFLRDEEKELLKSRLSKRLDTEGLLHIVSQEDRSQLLNKEKAVAKLVELIKKSLVVQKKRKPTKVPKSVIEKRLKDKSSNAERKRNRKLPDM
jgi:ribosome-associated protein